MEPISYSALQTLKNKPFQAQTVKLSKVKKQRRNHRRKGYPILIIPFCYQFFQILSVRRISDSGPSNEDQGSPDADKKLKQNISETRIPVKNITLNS